jgi:hypothetical protein
MNLQDQFLCQQKKRLSSPIPFLFKDTNIDIVHSLYELYTILLYNKEKNIYYFMRTWARSYHQALDKITLTLSIPYLLPCHFSYYIEIVQVQTQQYLSSPPPTHELGLVFSYTQNEILFFQPENYIKI